MVKVCSNYYNNENKNENYQCYFDYYENNRNNGKEFKLSPFQKWTIEAIVKGNNVLNSAPNVLPDPVCAQFKTLFPLTIASIVHF